MNGLVGRNYSTDEEVIQSPLRTTSGLRNSSFAQGTPRIVSGRFVWILAARIFGALLAVDSVSFNPAKETRIADKQFGP